MNRGWVGRAVVVAVLVMSVAGCDLLFPPVGTVPIDTPAPCPPGLAGPGCAPDDHAIVSGLVRGPAGELVPNVTVSYLLPGTAASASGTEPGRYEIDAPPGAVTFTWQAPGYAATSRSLVLEPRQRLELDVTLQRSP